MSRTHRKQQTPQPPSEPVQDTTEANVADEGKVSLGDRIRKLMEGRGLSQVDLSKKSGLDRAELNRLINNKRPPRTDEIRILAQVFEMSQLELVAGVELPPDVEKGVEWIVEKEAAALAAMHKAELAEARLAALEKAIEAERTANLQAKFNMAQEHRAELTAMRSEMSQMRVAHQTELVEVRRKHCAHVDELNASHELQMMQLHQQLQAQDAEAQRLAAQIALRDGALAMFDQQNHALRQKLVAQSNSAGSSAFVAGLLGLVVGGMGGAAAGSSSSRRRR